MTAACSEAAVDTGPDESCSATTMPNASAMAAMWVSSTGPPQ